MIDPKEISRYEALTNTSMDGFWELDLTGRIIAVNETMCRMYGYSREELLVRSLNDFEVAMDADSIKENIAHIIKIGYGRFETRHRCKDGTVFDVEVSTSYLVQSGTLLAFQRDISNRKRDEERLKVSEESYRAFAGLTSDYVHRCSRTGSEPFKIQWMGGSVGSICGYTPEEIYEKGCWLPLVHPEDRTAVASHLFSLVPGDQKQIEFRLVTKQGETRWIQENCHSIAGEQEGMLILFGAATDITTKKNTEEALKESEERFRTVMENIPTVAVQGYGLDGTVHFWNRASEQLYGYSAEEALGGNLLDLIIPAEMSEGVIEAVRHMSETGQVIPAGELLLQRKDGSRVPVYSSHALLHPAGRDPELFCLDINLTERYRAEEERVNLEKQLLHAQKLESLGVLAGGIAHDFNNILMAIIGNAELAMMRINKDSPAVDNLQRIEQAAARAADLAKQMLAYSGKGKFVVEHLDLNNLLEDMLHLLEASISKKSDLRLSLHRPLPTMEADATQMRQIIMNLIINASEAIGDGSGVIHITTGCIECDRAYIKNTFPNEKMEPGLYVFLEITDTGCGMDKETLSRIFDPFFTTKFTGRGLGMAAVLGIVHGHKGAIRVTSEKDRGTTFKVIIPASSRLAVTSDQIEKEDDWKGSGTVLLVDDEETVRDIGSAMLRELGFEPLTANDGHEAIEIFRSRNDICFVILDLTMPHVDGEQCFRELRALDHSIRVIMSSGYNEQEVTQRFVGKGLAGFVQKPYKLSVLKETIRRML